MHTHDDAGAQGRSHAPAKRPPNSVDSAQQHAFEVAGCIRIERKRVNNKRHQRYLGRLCEGGCTPQSRGKKASATTPRYGSSYLVWILDHHEPLMVCNHCAEEIIKFWKEFCHGFVE